MGLNTRRFYLDIEALVLPEGLVAHPEGFREAIASHLTRLMAEQDGVGLIPGLGATLRLESATLAIPEGMDIEAAAAHAALQLLAHLTGGRS